MTTLYDMPNDIQELIYHKKHKAEYKDIMNEFMNINEGWRLGYIDDYIYEYLDNVKEMNINTKCKCCNKSIKNRDELKYINGCVAGYCNFYCCKYCKDEVLWHNDEEDCFETTDKYRIILKKRTEE